MSKLVSVVVPNYNCEEYLDKCLDHIARQTYTNFECLVCDNGSVDNSVNIIKSWCAKDDRFRILINKENQGLINCYNRLFFEAKGDFIMIMDADDWCDITRIEKQLEVFDQHDVGCCMTNSIFYSPHSEPEYPKRPGSHIITLDSYEDWAPATIMFKREILETIPGYNKYFDRLTSYDNYLILEILCEYGAYYLDEYLYFVWARANSDHRSIDLTEPNALRKMIAHDIYVFLKKQRKETGTDYLKEKNFAALKEVEDKILSDKNFIADKIRVFGCIQIDYGNLKSGSALLKQAVKIAPFYSRNYRSFMYLWKARLKKLLGIKNKKAAA